MIHERHITEIGPDTPIDSGKSEFIYLKKTVETLTGAFLTQDTLGFEQAVEAFIKNIEVAHVYRNLYAEGKAIEEYVLHVIPDNLFDKLPKDIGEYVLKGSYLDERMVYVIPKAEESREVYSDDLALTKSELRATMRHIRQHIQEAMQRKQMEYVHLVDEKYGKLGRTKSLHSGNVYKEGLNTHEDPRPDKNLNALRRLYTLSERSPYLAYPTVTADEKYDARAGRQIRGKIQFTNLHDFMMQNPRPPLHRALRALRDGVRGIQFLNQKGFTLTDLDPSNIGVRPSGAGIIYDYDALLEADERGTYPAKKNFYPPDRHDALNMGATFLRKESDAAYELGMTLRNVLFMYQRPIMTGPVKAKLEYLTAQLLAEAPSMRPSLEELARELDIAIHTLAVEVNDEDVMYRADAPMNVPADTQPWQPERQEAVPTISSPFQVADGAIPGMSPPLNRLDKDAGTKRRPRSLPELRV